jgi:hypothetical protein
MLANIVLNEAKTKLRPSGRNCPTQGPGKSVSFDFLGLSQFVSRAPQGRHEETDAVTPHVRFCEPKYSNE